MMGSWIGDRQIQFIHFSSIRQALFDILLDTSEPLGMTLFGAGRIVNFLFHPQSLGSS